MFLHRPCVKLNTKQCFKHFCTDQQRINKRIIRLITNKLNWLHNQIIPNDNKIKQKKTRLRLENRITGHRRPPSTKMWTTDKMFEIPRINQKTLNIKSSTLHLLLKS